MPAARPSLATVTGELVPVFVPAGADVDRSSRRCPTLGLHRTPPRLFFLPPSVFGPLRRWPVRLCRPPSERSIPPRRSRSARSGARCGPRACSSGSPACGAMLAVRLRPGAQLPSTPAASRGAGWLGGLLAAPAARWDAAWYLVIAHYGYRPDLGAFSILAHRLLSALPARPRRARAPRTAADRRRACCCPTAALALRAVRHPPPDDARAGGARRRERRRGRAPGCAG